MSSTASLDAPLAMLLAALPPAAPGSAEESRLAALVGRKALSLGQLAASGLPVPPAGVVTAVAHGRFLAVDHLAAAIAGATVRGVAADGAGREGAREVRAAIASLALPADVTRAIIEVYRALGGGPVAVRSSGVAEDLAGASFAGMYESFLNVEGEAAVVDAVRRCWASAWSDRVAAYAARQGMTPAGLAMGVVIQRLVAAEAAGVAFTLDPTTGLEAHMRVEACRGLGEALVGGEVQPDAFLLERATGRVLERQVVPKTTQLMRASGGGVTEVALAPDAQQAPAVDDGQLVALAALCRRAQAVYGTPQDIEWAIADGRIWLLQARPITAISFTGIEGEWTTADFKDGGVSASVCSPYMWSLYDAIWQVTMPGYMRRINLLNHDEPVQWARVFYGRPYWNCGEVKRVLHRVPGFNERNFDRDLGIEGTYEGDGVVVPTNAWTVLNALPTLFALGREYADRIRLNERFVKAFEGLAARYDVDPARLDRNTLARRYRQLLTRDYVETESAYFYTIYNTSNAKMDFKAELDKLNAALPEGEPPISYLELLSGLRDLRHLEPLRDLWTLAGGAHAHPALREAILATPVDAMSDALASAHGQFWQEVVAFLHRYRHHSVAELDITQPRWNEEPGFVLATLKTYVSTYDAARDPDRANERQYDVYLAALNRAERAIARQGALARFVAYGNLTGLEDGFFAKLHRCRTYAWWREEMRDRSSRMYALVRRETLAVARLLGREGVLERPDDVWQLTHGEVLELLDGRLAADEARSRVAARREYGDGWRAFGNPNELGRRFKLRTDVVPEDGSTLVGIGCSAGVVKARVRVVPTIHDAHQLQPGEILVTKFTDPGWTPLFGTIAGVVTETGGVLSHAAVIAREYGIPAVLAVPGATAALKDGMWVQVDGSAGTVTPHPEANP